MNYFLRNWLPAALLTAYGIATIGNLVSSVVSLTLPWPTALLYPIVGIVYGNRCMGRHIDSRLGAFYFGLFWIINFMAYTWLWLRFREYRKYNIVQHTLRMYFED